MIILMDKHKRTIEIRPGSRSGQEVLLMEQFMDYHMFQGFSHFYFYDHTYDRSEDDIDFFYNPLHMDGYFDADVATLIDWPTVVHLHEPTRYHQQGLLMDSMRRFMFESEYIFFGDIDEWIVPKNTEHANIETILARYIQFPTTIDHGAFAVDAFPGFQDMYNFFNHPSQVHPINKELGCNATDIDNRFDTFLARGNCLLSAITNEEQGRETHLLELSLKLGSNIWYNATNAAKFLQQIIDPKERMLEGFTKVISNPRKTFLGLQHRLYITRNPYDKEPKEKSKPKSGNVYFGRAALLFEDMFIVHIRDHFNRFDASEYVSYTNPNDMKVFYSAIESKCQFNEYIIYWNEQFLQSQIGNLKYNNRYLIDPLIDKDGIFCYAKNNPNFREDIPDYLISNFEQHLRYKEYLNKKQSKIEPDHELQVVAHVESDLNQVHYGG